ncbi:hypothetical protein BJ165DRAFT_1447237 [Panaeolus papilionaceus]|nr:hypothetical protein BJ165DRAFT_1447237 [Panaeolus papilionaceus]
MQMATRSSASHPDKTRRPSQARIKRGVLNVNTTGLPAFPDELLLEVASHMPRVPVSCHTAEEIVSYDSDTTRAALDSQFMLTALSRTCQRLRQFFLPYMYQTVEVLDGMKIVDGRRLPTTKQREAKRLAYGNLSMYTKELARQLEVLTVRNPPLAQYVVKLNVVLTLSDYNTSLAKRFWDYLNLLPNLSSVRMVCQYSWMSMDIVRKWRLPQIRHVHLNVNATTFALSCPNLVSVSTAHAIDLNRISRYWGPNYWRMTTPEIKKNIEVIGVNCILRKDIGDFSNLRDMSFECLAIRDIIKRPIKRKNMKLETIRIHADQIGVFYVPMLGYSCTVYTPKPTPEEEMRWISWCEETLREVQRVDQKDKRIYYTSSSGARSFTPAGHYFMLC